MNTLYVFDYGLSLNYRSRKQEHIPQSANNPIGGTANYSSINTHIGINQSRRDDLEQLGYLLLFFLCEGKLPWMNASENSI